MFIEPICDVMASDIGINKQIQKMHFEDGLTPTQIAESLGYNEDAIIQVLAQRKSRDAAKDASISDRMKSSEDIAIATMEALAESAENEGVRQRAAEFIIKAQKGVFDKRNVTPGVSIETLNVIITQARERHEKMKGELVEV